MLPVLLVGDYLGEYQGSFGRKENFSWPSTGHVRLRSGDPKQKAAITANYLKEPEDMQAMITAAERTREVFASAPLRGLVIPPACRARP